MACGGADECGVFDGDPGEAVRTRSDGDRAGGEGSAAGGGPCGGGGRLLCEGGPAGEVGGGFHRVGGAGAAVAAGEGARGQVKGDGGVAVAAGAGEGETVGAVRGGGGAGVAVECEFDGVVQAIKVGIEQQIGIGEGVSGEPGIEPAAVGIGGRDPTVGGAVELRGGGPAFEFAEVFDAVALLRSVRL